MFLTTNIYFVWLNAMPVEWLLLRVATDNNHEISEEI